MPGSELANPHATGPKANPLKRLNVSCMRAWMDERTDGLDGSLSVCPSFHPSVWSAVLSGPVCPVCLQCCVMVCYDTNKHNMDNKRSMHNIHTT